MCLVAFQKMFRKIFSDVWLCSWKHIFYLLLNFLTFSQLPNEYIISFIPQNTNITQKKNHQIRTNEGEIAIGAVSASRDRDWRIARYRSKLRAITIDAFTLSRSKLRAIAIGTVPVMSAKGVVPVMSQSLLSFSLSLSLSLSLSSTFQGRKSFEVKMETEMIFRCFGSEIRSTGNAFQFDRIWSNNQTPHFPDNHFRNQFEVNSNAA